MLDPFGPSNTFQKNCKTNENTTFWDPSGRSVRTEFLQKCKSIFKLMFGRGLNSQIRSLRSLLVQEIIKRSLIIPQKDKSRLRNPIEKLTITRGADLLSLWGMPRPEKMLFTGLSFRERSWASDVSKNVFFRFVRKLKKVGFANKNPEERKHARVVDLSDLTRYLWAMILQHRSIFL